MLSTPETLIGEGELIIGSLLRQQSHKRHLSRRFLLSQSVSFFSVRCRRKEFCFWVFGGVTHDKSKCCRNVLRHTKKPSLTKIDRNQSERPDVQLKLKSIHKLYASILNLEDFPASRATLIPAQRFIIPGLRMASRENRSSALKMKIPWQTMLFVAFCCCRWAALVSVRSSTIDKWIGSLGNRHRPWMNQRPLVGGRCSDDCVGQLPRSIISHAT